MKSFFFVLLFSLCLNISFAVDYDELSVEMRDGIKLTTFVMKTGDGARPTLLIRTPYLSGASDDEVDLSRLHSYAGFGMMLQAHVVVQAMRGTFTSEGIFRWLDPKEIEDGADTLAWLERQDFFNDQVFLQGVSYPGFGALATALTGHPSIKLIFTGSAPTDPLTDSFTAGGMIGFGLLNYLYSNANMGCEDMSWMWCYHKMDSFKHDPNFFDFDEFLFDTDLEEWNYVVEHFLDLKSPFWTGRGIRNRLKEINIPTIHVGGMVHDQDGRDALYNYLEIQNNSPYKDKHHLILGRWGHDPFRGDEVIFQIMAMAYKEIMIDGKDKISFLPQVLVSSASGDGTKFMAGDRYPVKEIYHENNFYLASDGENKVVLSSMEAGNVSSKYSFNPLEDSDDAGLQFAQPIRANMNINGMIELDLALSIDTPQTDLYVNIYKWSKGSWKQLFITTFADRKRFYSDGNVVRLKLQTPPLYEQLKAGDYLLYYIESGNQKFGYNAFLNHNVADDKYFEEIHVANVTLHHSFLLTSKVMIPTEEEYLPGSKFIKGVGETTMLPPDWEKQLKEFRAKIQKDLVF